MKKIKLTKGKFALIDDEDFELISQYRWHVAKNTNTYYAHVTIRNKIKTTLTMHRLIMDDYFDIESKQIDHINGNGLDNRKSNLRLCNNTQNQQNRKKNKNKKLPKGIDQDNRRKTKYRARIRVAGILKYLGEFNTIEEAKNVYQKVSIRYFGEFSRND